MIPWINYHHLFYFKTIAEEGTVSKAAEKLKLGQPTYAEKFEYALAPIAVTIKTDLAPFSFAIFAARTG